MKRILIPTDFSDCAAHASMMGIELAQRMGTQISFLHLISTPVEWSDLSLAQEKLYPQTQQAIVQAKDELLKLEQLANRYGISANSLLLFKTGHIKIHDHIRKDQYSLVVMGAHARKSWFIGGTTRTVLDHSPTPVLVIKLRDHYQSLKKIGIASDFKENSRKSFGKLLQLAIKLELMIDVVFINTPYNFWESNQIKKTMDGFLPPSNNLQVRRCIFNAFNEERGLGMYIKEEAPDIVGTITHRHSGLGSLFRTGVTENIINHFQVPVLSIHQESPSG